MPKLGVTNAQGSFRNTGPSERLAPRRPTIRHVAFLRSTSTLRLVAAQLLLGAALAGALVLYGHRERLVHCYVGQPGPAGCTEQRGWVAPTALAIALLGVGAAGSLLLTKRRNSS
jgi:hypothetical protein